MSCVKKNSLKAWFLAARPKTLTGAIAPVMIAIALAHADSPNMFSDLTNGKWGLTLGDARIIASVLCFLFAIVMQIDANFINDYYDFCDGIDKEDRLGPKRACQQGWITLSAMQHGIISTTVIAVIIGLPTIILGGWGMIVIGLLCTVFAFLYTTILSRLGMGDILVLFFFGIIPVCTTYYLLLGTVTADCLCLSLGMGTVTDLLLLVNNYRDYETDLNHGKRTLVNIIGRTATKILYTALGIVATCAAIVVINHHTTTFTSMWMLVFLMWHIRQNFKLFNSDCDFNRLLGTTAIGIFLYALCAAFTLYSINSSPHL